MVAEAAIVLIFFTVYAGMILGGLPFLQRDRAGAASASAGRSTHRSACR
jgi:Flp pilus assembly protein TadG